MFKRWAEGEYEVNITLRLHDIGDPQPIKVIEWGNELIPLERFLKEARGVSPSNPKSMDVMIKGHRMSLRIVGIEVIRLGEKSIDLRLIAEKK
ncbi:MAG: hypothetical protein ACUVQ0_05820 [Thermoproteota archaeon]